MGLWFPAVLVQLPVVLTGFPRGWVREVTAPTADVEQVMVRAAALFRVGGLVQVAIVLALDGGRFPATAVLVAAVAAESALVVTSWIRAGVLHPVPVCTDTGFCMTALVAGAALAAPHGGFTWAHFMYPFTLITSVGIGLTFRRLLTVEVMTMLLAATYAISAVAFHLGPAWNAAPNALSYFGNTTVAWAVARTLRRNAQATDESRTQAVAHARRAAQHEIRARHARALHDRALQALETLARGPWITDPALRSHIAAEAAWLRAFVENDNITRGPVDLLTGLQHLVQHKALMGLHVELATAALRDSAEPPLDPRIVSPLLDAVGEALTNVAKHAGVSHATIRARLNSGTVEISVADNGRGFDPATATAGLGLRSSITARLAEIGGTATIDSSPGDGTVIRLVTPRH